MKQDNIDFSWLIELSEKTNSLKIGSSGTYNTNNLEDIQSKLPFIFKKFLSIFNGIQDFDGIKILTIAEITEELTDEIFQRQFPFDVIPFAKYNYEYAYLVFDENGKVYRYDHDDENVRPEYPDFLGFMLWYSLFYALNSAVYEDLAYSSAEINTLVAHFENLLMEKLTAFDFVLDEDHTPNWSKWNIEKTI